MKALIANNNYDAKNIEEVTINENEIFYLLNGETGSDDFLYVSKMLDNLNESGSNFIFVSTSYRTPFSDSAKAGYAPKEYFTELKELLTLVVTKNYIARDDSLHVNIRKGELLYYLDDNDESFDDSDDSDLILISSNRDDPFSSSAKFGYVPKNCLKRYNHHQTYVLPQIETTKSLLDDNDIKKYTQGVRKQRRNGMFIDTNSQDFKSFNISI